MFKSSPLHFLRLLVVAGLAVSAASAADKNKPAQESHSVPVATAAPGSHGGLQKQDTPISQLESNPGTVPIGGASPASSPAEPASLFDAIGTQSHPVRITVEVRGLVQQVDTTAPVSFRAGAQEIISSAGTYGDISRYLQTAPGVVSSSDMSNEFFVRGGHPVENLFLVDGIEMPNINSLATLGTTGGFGPMIDTATIQSVSLASGGYEAHYPERLSSVTEITTLDPLLGEGHREADLGIQGFGGLEERPLGGGDLLASVHHGIINALGSGFGAHLPAYTNALARFRRSDAVGTRLTLLDVAGMDSLDIVPCAKDALETSTIDSHYRGWRNTAGLEWQQVYSPKSFGVVSMSDSEQVEHIHQDDQLIDPLHQQYYGPDDDGCSHGVPGLVVTPVYLDRSNDAFTTTAYRYERSTTRVTLDAGTSAELDRPHFNISQPAGMFSPYSADPARSDSTSFSSNVATGQTGSFAQAVVHPWRALGLSGGVRLQTFAFGSRTTVTPRASARWSVNRSLALEASYGSYAQLPPWVYMLAYAENRSMRPMRATHQIVGMDWSRGAKAQLHMEGFDKQYDDIPASTEYPSVTFHNIASSLTDQVVWLRMSSVGRGRSSGIEISETSHFGSLDLRASVAYARAKFAGVDGVMRPSNFDFPWIVNLASHQKLGRSYELSTRYTYTTGRPYTPYDMRNSRAQDRPIYDVSRLNAVRGPFYSRLDAQIDKDIRVHGRHLELYGGVENLLNRTNLLCYMWEPRNFFQPVTEEDQTPIFPNFGIRYLIH
ncbi:MAG TPA: TonB-dependent receptor [Acidobacteriaceae bacterium]|nr:TonB-dependent receptor [Acidobacteriaceae bacterium]